MRRYLDVLFSVLLQAAALWIVTFIFLWTVALIWLQFSHPEAYHYLHDPRTVGDVRTIESELLSNYRFDQRFAFACVLLASLTISQVAFISVSRRLDGV